MKILDLDLDLAFEITRDFGLNNFDNSFVYLQHGHPYISAMVNNGTLHYDHDRDGTHTELAGCEAQFRNKPHDTYVAVRYERNTLTVSTSQHLKILSPPSLLRSRVAGTMVARSSSIRMIARSNLKQLPPLLIHVGKSPAVMLAVKRLAEVNLGECTLLLALQNKQIRQNPLWLEKPEETSPEIQNRGISGPRIESMCPPKTFFKKRFKAHLHRKNPFVSHISTSDRLNHFYMQMSTFSCTLPELFSWPVTWEFPLTATLIYAPHVMKSVQVTCN